MPAETTAYGDLHVTIGDDHVAIAEIRRPPNNFFDLPLIDAMADAFHALDADPRCRAVVLCSEGRHFCAGADFGSRDDAGRADDGSNDAGADRHLYDAGVRLFEVSLPIVAAVQGAAIGGGLGVACMADFRVAAPEARFAANFARLGFHHGFGLTALLPDIVGKQKALEMLYTGQRLKGEEAAEIGLVDKLVPLDDLRPSAHALAREIAISAPLAVASIKKTMRGDLVARYKAATDHEKVEQDRLRQTNDFKEGVKAMAERRDPDFTAT